MRLQDHLYDSLRHSWMHSEEMKWRQSSRIKTLLLPMQSKRYSQIRIIVCVYGICIKMHWNTYQMCSLHINLLHMTSENSFMIMKNKMSFSHAGNTYLISTSWGVMSVWITYTNTWKVGTSIWPTTLLCRFDNHTKKWKHKQLF